MRLYASEWEFDIYGKFRTFAGRSLNDCPFRYQGQYEDRETGLYYNRFRYYDPSTGAYISQDPIGLAGGNPTLYGYVCDPNSWVDTFGLSECCFNGVKEASEYLKDMGVPRAKRKEILESFELGTIRVQKAGPNEFGIRFFGGDARPIGQFLTDTFGPTTNRVNLALPPKWNSMAGIKQWQIKPGTTIIKGKVGPQLSEGTQYVGGANQIFVLEPWKYGTLF